MNNKDLFNAIDKAAEDYSPELRELIEGERPMILRAEKRSKKKNVRGIMLGVGGAAAAAALCVCVVTGVKRGLDTAPTNSSTTDKHMISYFLTEVNEQDVVRINDVGFYSAKWDAEWLASFGDWFDKRLSYEEYAERYSPDRDIVLPRPDVYYYNDIPFDARMFTNKAEIWLYKYCCLTDEDREKMAAEEPMPDYVKFLTGKGFVRFGDLGFLEEKYTEAELESIKEYLAMPFPQKALSSAMPPQPDVYYYDDMAYNPDRISSDDAKNWLSWYCRLDDDLQEQLSGYVPEGLTGTITACNSEKPGELVTYKGKTFDVRSVSYDTEKYIKWYNSLPGELRKKVWYVPKELEPERLNCYPDAESFPELIGADGVKLTYNDLTNATIYKYLEEGDKGGGLEQIRIGDIEQWDEIIIPDFVYLAEEGSDTFTRYNIGDTLKNGLTIEGGSAVFKRAAGEDDHALYYVGGSVLFGGSAKFDMLVVDNDCIDQVTVAVSGLPAVNTDDSARAEGRIAPRNSP